MYYRGSELQRRVLQGSACIIAQQLPAMQNYAHCGHELDMMFSRVALVLVNHPYVLQDCQTHRTEGNVVCDNKFAEGTCCISM